MFEFGLRIKTIIQGYIEKPTPVAKHTTGVTIEHNDSSNDAPYAETIVQSLSVEPIMDYINTYPMNSFNATIEVAEGNA